MDDLYNDFPWWKERNGTSLTRRFSHVDYQTTNNNRTGAVRVIDIRNPDAAAFIDTLVSCKLVASASLHGLILAEAYNVTWSWVRLRDKHEAAFKYHDFFVSVGIDPTTANVSIFCLWMHYFVNHHQDSSTDVYAALACTCRNRCGSDY